MKSRAGSIAIAILLLCFAFCAHAGKPRIGLLCPEPEEDPFWGEVAKVMREAAGDLDIELIVNCSRRGTLATKRAGNNLLATDPPLDFFITGYWPTVTKHHLDLANERGISVFVFNANVIEEDKADVGEPRGKYKKWIGHMVPNDRDAAIELTNTLIDKAHKELNISAAKSLDVIALLGTGSTSIGRDRNYGISSTVEAQPNASLHKIVMDYYQVDWARDETVKVLSNYPNTQLAIGANQEAAWGAVRGAEKAGRLPGKDIFIGGFDWNSESVKAIQDGRISASMFGHFLEGAWALILCHDYYYGYDFADDLGIKMRTPLAVISPDNFEKYKVVLSDEHWKNVDFRTLSKKYNPELKKYNFSISQFLK